METITFYSYKGGVGRSLALANIATYLYSLGFKVCLLDFDLEAPGLPFKFPPEIKISMEDIEAGLVDYIHFFLKNDKFPSSLKKFSRELSSTQKSRGSIRLIPAGNTFSIDYWKKTSSINWYSLFYSEDEDSNVGIPLFLELKERIEKEFNPDYLLIDSRSGITEMSGICTSVLPDKVVFFIINNRENLEGARQILRGLQKVKRLSDQEPIKVIFALSRIPLPLDDKPAEIEAEKKLLNDIIDHVNASIDDLAHQINLDDICILHSERELAFSEALKFPKKESEKETPLYHDYLKLFYKIFPIPKPSQSSSQFSHIAFISFCGADRVAATQLVSNLRADGINVWLDEKEFKPGDNFDETIFKAIKECPVFIPLISRDANSLLSKSGELKYHVREWEFAYSSYLLNGDKHIIIPVIIDDTDWSYEKFKKFYALRIPNGGRGKDYEKLKRRLLELQESDK